MERKPFRLTDYLYYCGDWNLFLSAINNPDTIYIYDADGILVDSPKKVLADFLEKTGIKVDPAQIDRFNALTYIATQEGLPEDVIATAEDGWYDPNILGGSPRYFFSKPILNLTMQLVGPERNYVLTSRLPNLEDSTQKWLRKQHPFLPEENLLIRTSSTESETVFKVDKIKEQSEKAPYVIYFEDSIKFVKAVLEDGPVNCVVVNIPVGQIRSDLEHERLFVVGRYPYDCQGMYPLYRLLKEAITNSSPSHNIDIELVEV